MSPISAFRFQDSFACSFMLIFWHETWKTNLLFFSQSKTKKVCHWRTLGLQNLLNFRSTVPLVSHVWDFTEKRKVYEPQSTTSKENNSYKSVTTQSLETSQFCTKFTYKIEAKLLQSVPAFFRHITSDPSSTNMFSQLLERSFHSCFGYYRKNLKGQNWIFFSKRNAY